MGQLIQKTVEKLDRDRLWTEITESAKRANGVRFPSDRETELTIEKIQKNWEAFIGKPPQEGEWVQIGDKYCRIAHVWSHENGITGLQPATYGMGGSFYLFDGFGSFSGALDAPVNMRLEHTGYMLAHFWMFYGNSSGAHRGVWFTIPARVWTEVKA